MYIATSTNISLGSWVKSQYTLNGGTAIDGRIRYIPDADVFLRSEHDWGGWINISERTLLCMFIEIIITQIWNKILRKGWTRSWLCCRVQVRARVCVSSLVVRKKKFIYLLSIIHIISVVMFFVEGFGRFSNGNILSFIKRLHTYFVFKTFYFLLKFLDCTLITAFPLIPLWSIFPDTPLSLKQ